MESSSRQRANVPSHVLVQRQLQDLIIAQREAVHRLKHNVNEQEITMRDSYVSREEHELIVRKFEEQMETNYVSKAQYNSLHEELQKEQLSHVATAGQLMEVRNRLDYAFGEIDSLKQQILREKATFEKAFGTIKVRAMQESTKNLQLESKFTDMENHCDKQEDILSSKEMEIDKLEKKLKLQRNEYQKQVGEMEVQLQQELYISKMLDNQGKRKTNKARKPPSDKR